MMTTATAPSRPDWALLLPEAAEIVRSYDTLVTLRQLFYRLVALGRLPNLINAYKSLSRHTAEARRRGAFPDLIDRGRTIHGSSHFDNIADALNWTTEHYMLDRTIGQEYGIYLCIEKAGIIEQVEAWFGDYGFPVLALSGYCSQSHVDEVVRHVRAVARPAVLLYAGDYDASGEDILRDFVERTGCWDLTRHVALSQQQVTEYHLSATPGKDTDSRKNGFVEKHGEFVQVELDALRPDDLHELFLQSIREFWDESANDTIMGREEGERRKLQSLVRKWREKKRQAET
jgi:hypothetical protein